MSFIFQCPACGKRYQVQDHLAGTSTRCLQCGAAMHLPGRADLATLDPALSPLAAGSPLTPVSRQSPNQLFMIAAAVGAAVVLLLIVVVAALFMGRGKPPVVATPSQAYAPGAYSPGQRTPRPVPFGQAPAPLPSPPPTATSAAIPPTMHGATSAIPDATSGSPFKSLDALPETPPVATAGGSVDSGPEWGERAAPVANIADVEWGGAAAEIPVNEQQGLTFGPPGCPMLVSGNQVWDIARKKLLAELEGEREGRATATLSPDGRWFAAADKTPNQEETAVIVWDTQTGARKFTAPGRPEEFSDMILLSNERLLVGGRSNSTLYMWNLTTGEALKPRQLSGMNKGFERGNTGISLDGKYLATPAHDKLVVMKIDTGKVVAVMSPPKLMERNTTGQSVIVQNNRIVADSRAGSTDAVFIYAWLQTVSFSPDLQELAAVSTHPVSRLICWNSRGKLTYDEPFYDARRAFWENTMEWFPDRKAWLIAGDVFDRDAGRIVLSVKEKFGEDMYLHVYDNDHLVGNFPHNPASLEVLQIPWKDIRATLAHMQSEGAALLGPSLPVSIAVELGELRGEQSETIRTLEQALVRRLARDGLRASPGSATYFRLKFAETAGDRLPIYERQSPFDFRGQDTGQTAVEARGSLVVELIVPGQTQPIWRDNLSVTSSRSFSEDINDATLRKSMLENIAHEINELNFPYFIPQSKDLLALPVVIGGGS